MMGRIGEVVREQAGLAYHAGASLNAMVDAGSWEISAGVNPINLERAIDLIKKEVERFVTEPVTAGNCRIPRIITSVVCRWRLNRMGGWRIPCLISSAFSSV
jgi:hypothetical protein